MTTRMIHPEHGATHAYGAGEVERLESLGWAVEGEPCIAKFESVTSNAYPAPDVVQFYADPGQPKRKPGRPAKSKG